MTCRFLCSGGMGRRARARLRWDNVQPAIEPKNILAMADAVRKLGSYPLA